MERKVLIVRLWLLTALVVAIGCWEPTLWFGVPLFFFPNCACCGAVACAHCSGTTTPRNMQVELSGITDGACTECAEMNTTWVLPQATEASCFWVTEDIDTCDFTSVSVQIQGLFGSVFSLVQVEKLAPALGGLGWQASVGSDPTNCTAINSLAHTPGSDGDCVISGSTCLLSDIP